MKRLLPLLLLPAAAQPAPVAERAAERELMALTVANLASASGASAKRALDPRVLGALRTVPRHLFVPPAAAAMAYRDTALPIGHGQTISQPTIVALMTHLLEVEPSHRVLEIGTGSGYQAAILSMLAAEVRSIEIVAPLAREAEARLARLGYANVTVRPGDGYGGWPESGPFDRIIVTAAAPYIPKPLIAQLKPGGRMVIPVSRGRNADELMLVEKSRDGTTRTRRILPVRFVPLTRER
ncbi:MAG TPA: protein-L-isoaspartate(D-aspartate) O-methyltransferase [Allosphingosinicella sp.]|nr:protein-L-isoaspartate(D-aspartate) O-methyltransferase [Allosphingosinicella sp.]